MNIHSSAMCMAVLAVLAGTPLKAAEPGPWDAGVSAVLPLDGLEALTRRRGLGGFTLEAGYNGTIRGTRVPFRASATLGFMDGRQRDYVKSSLGLAQLAGDIIAPTGIASLDLVAGLSVNQWRWDYQDPTVHSRITMKGPKAGVRLGFDLRIRPRWTASVLLQVTELGVSSDASHAYNPSWIQAGLKYRF